jgi:hypothetical protein
MEDLDDGRIYVQASTASEATAAVGVYLRDFCNLTVGWPRGGGSFVQQPAQARAARIAVVDRITGQSRHRKNLNETAANKSSITIFLPHEQRIKTCRVRVSAIFFT